jgi:hypothetical protein
MFSRAAGLSGRARDGAQVECAVSPDDAGGDRVVCVYDRMRMRVREDSLRIVHRNNASLSSPKRTYEAMTIDERTHMGETA